MDTNDSYKFSSIGLIHFALKHWKPLLIFPAAMFIISALVSLTIKDKYQSSLIMFPAAQTSISQTLLSSTGGTEDGITTIGEEEQAEHLLQVLHSENIRSKIIEKYDLMHHYRIKDDDKYKMTKLFKKYKKNITFKRTEFMSIEVNVLDEDPQMAADIANDIGILLDSTMNMILKDRAVKAFKIVQQEYFTLNNQIKTLEDSLVTLGKLGVYEPEVQAQALSEAYSESIIKGDTKSMEKLKKEMDVLAKYGSRFNNIVLFLEFEKSTLSMLKTKYAEAKVEAEQKIPHKFIVDSAFKAERKSYPKRSLIVIFSAFAAFILTFVTLLIIENIKEYNKAL